MRRFPDQWQFPYFSTGFSLSCIQRIHRLFVTTIPTIFIARCRSQVSMTTDKITSRSQPLESVAVYRVWCSVPFQRATGSWIVSRKSASALRTLIQSETSDSVKKKITLKITHLIPYIFDASRMRFYWYWKRKYCAYDCEPHAASTPEICEEGRKRRFLSNWIRGRMHLSEALEHETYTFNCTFPTPAPVYFSFLFFSSTTLVWAPPPPPPPQPSLVPPIPTPTGNRIVNITYLMHMPCIS